MHVACCIAFSKCVCRHGGDDKHEAPETNKALMEGLDELRGLLKSQKGDKK